MEEEEEYKPREKRAGGRLIEDGRRREEEHKPREEGRSVSKKRGPIDRGWKEEEEEHKPREEGKREPIDRGRRSTSRVRKEGA